MMTNGEYWQRLGELVNAYSLHTAAAARGPEMRPLYDDRFIVHIRLPNRQVAKLDASLAAHRAVLTAIARLGFAGWCGFDA